MSQPMTAAARSAGGARLVGVAIVTAICALGGGVGLLHFTGKPAAYKLASLPTPQASQAPANSAHESVNLPPTAARAALGKRIFFDKSLSEPAGTSCASCHDPAHGFAGNNGSKLGVALGSRPGHFATRNTPSVMYLKFAPHFHLHWEEDAPVVDAYGGFFWDGRVDELADVPKQPLMNP
ncbi:MAG TPA: cytochrome-c peroxidase, partial [Polyangiaceae bacterium]